MSDESVRGFMQNLSVRTQRCLVNDGLTTIEAIAARTVAQLLLTPNLNRRSLMEIVDMLAEHGLAPAGEPPPPKDRIREFAVEMGLDEADLLRLRQLHTKLRRQQSRRDAVRRELEVRLARTDARIDEIARAGAALADCLKIPVAPTDGSWAGAVERLGLAANTPQISRS